MPEYQPIPANSSQGGPDEKPPRNSCSYCGGVLSPAATACPHCGHPNAASPAPTAKVPSGAERLKAKAPLMIADASVVTAFLLNVLVPHSYLFTIPLYVAAFVLAIIALSRGRAKGDAIIVLIASIVLPFLGMGFSCARETLVL